MTSNLRANPSPDPSVNPAHEIVEAQTTDCCIVGGGPAGAVLALLLARQGISVILLEAHKDFDRDFRGDTIHPSVMEIMEEIGLSDRFGRPSSSRSNLTSIFSLSKWYNYTTHL